MTWANVSAPRHRPRALLLGIHVMAVIAVVLVALPSCDSLPALQHLGVAPGPEPDAFQVRYVGCPGERVLAVSIEWVAHTPSVVFWKISSKRGTSQTVFDVGKPASGFSTDRALTAPLPVHRDLVAVVRTTSFEDLVESFEVTLLRSGLVFTGDDKYMTVQSFEERARNRCK